MAMVVGVVVSAGAAAAVFFVGFGGDIGQGCSGPAPMATPVYVSGKLGLRLVLSRCPTLREPLPLGERLLAVLTFERR